MGARANVETETHPNAGRVSRTGRRPSALRGPDVQVSRRRAPEQSRAAVRFGTHEQGSVGSGENLHEPGSGGFCRAGLTGTRGRLRQCFGNASERQS